MALIDNIWWTKKARIHAEQRLLAIDCYFKLLLAWFSFCSIAVSVYFLVYPQNKDFQIVLLIFSIIIFCLSCLIPSFQYKERANLFRQCYLALDKISRNSQNSNQEALLAEQYQEVLNLCENHTEYDYYWAVLNEYYSLPDEMREYSKNASSGQEIPENYKKRIVTKVPSESMYCKAITILFLKLIFSVLGFLLPPIILYVTWILGQTS